MGITGALQTGRDRRGGDVVYFAITNGADIWTVQIAFQRKDEDGNGWTREQQQLIVDVVGLQLITWALKQRLAGRQPLLWRLKQEAEYSLCLNESLFPARLYSPERRPGVKTDDGRTSLPTLKQFCFEPTPLRSLPLDLTKVLSSGIPTLLTEQGEAVPADVARLQQSSSGKLCLIPTSSRPLHEGHLWMAYIARELGMNPCFAITRSHAGGKPSVSNTELEQRAADFLGRSNVLFLQGPYLVSMMSELQINEASDPVCFLLGMDVAEKLLDHSLPTCLRDLEELRRNRVTIYVLVRAGVQKRLADLLAGPVQEYASMFRELDLNGPEVSSTEIRSILGMDERRG